MLFGFLLSVVVGIVIYQQLTDAGSDPVATVVVALGAAFVVLLVFYAWFAWEYEYRASHSRRKLGK